MIPLKPEKVNRGTLSYLDYITNFDLCQYRHAIFTRFIISENCLTIYVSLFYKMSEVIFMKAEFKGQYEQLGLNIVYYRKKKKLTQLQLAELVDIDRSHISAIELGNVGASLDVIFKLCEVLCITPKTLFDFRD